MAVDSDLSRRAPSRSRAAAIVVVALLVAGLAARFIELDRHYYFRDEAVTSLRVSGFTNADFDRFVTDHEVTQLLALIESEKLRVFYARVPAQFGVLNADAEDIADGAAHPGA